MKSLIKRIPVVRDAAKWIYFRFVAPYRKFPGSEDYWKQRYREGGNSGSGSYRKLAEFKAGILNELVREHGIQSVLEYGCGDGNQLRLASYPQYTGFDISPEAVAMCRQLFHADAGKSFRLMQDYAGETADMVLSLDVIYHLVEDEVFEAYMHRLFDSATRLVVVYSSNTNEQASLQAPHVRHRKFGDWIERHRPQWRMQQHIPNPYRQAANEEDASFADFYVYTRSS